MSHFKDSESSLEYGAKRDMGIQAARRQRLLVVLAITVAHYSMHSLVSQQ